MVSFVLFLRLYKRQFAVHEKFSLWHCFSVIHTYFGASDTDKYSWQENYDGSSGLQGTVATPLLSGLPVSQLEIDRWESVVGFCPLLEDPANYTPDTLNLTQDNEARSFFPKLPESS